MPLIDIQRDADIRLLLRSGRVLRGHFIACDEDSMTLRDDSGWARIPFSWVTDWQVLEPPLEAKAVDEHVSHGSDGKTPEDISPKAMAAALQVTARVRALIADATLPIPEPSFVLESVGTSAAQRHSLEQAIAKLQEQWIYAHKVNNISRLQSLRIPILNLVNEHPSSPLVASLQGTIALALGNYPLALDAFTRAVRLRPDPAALLNLAVAAGHHNRSIMLGALLRYFDSTEPHIDPRAWQVMLGTATELKHTAPLVPLMQRWVACEPCTPFIVDGLIYLLTDGDHQDTAHAVIQTLSETPRPELSDYVRRLVPRASQAVIDDLENFWRRGARGVLPDIDQRKHLPAPPPSPPDTVRSTVASGHEASRTVSRSSSLLASSPTRMTLSARAAFDTGDLGRAKEYFVKAYDSGDRSLIMFLNFVQTLQRLQEFDQALSLIDTALTLHRADSDRAKLITARAHIHSSRQEWDAAANAYEELLRIESRPAAQRHVTLQLSAMYLRAGHRQQAFAALNAFLARNPKDEVARRQLASLNAFGTDTPDTLNEDVVGEFTVDVPDQPEGTISPLLQRDLEIAQFRDELVLAKGGRADQFDAKRLLQHATSVKNAEFPERYPLFLEAAKAFSQLPEGSYHLGDFMEALSRYAMLKAGALTSELQRRLTVANSRDIRFLADSATSYYLEALVFQASLRPEFMLVPLTNFLRVQIACTLHARRQPIPANIFSWPLASLFKYCASFASRAPLANDSLAQELTRLAFDTVISCGAAGGKTWNAVSRVNRGQLRRLVSQLLETTARRAAVYQILSEISGMNFAVDQRPSEVLRQAFIERARRAEETRAFCQATAKIPATAANYRELNRKWSQFPNYPETLLETDCEIRRQIDNLLATLSLYTARTYEEREGILFTARTTIEGLLRFIDDHPTRWGREAFEPLLSAWKTGIHNIEIKRAREIQPKLRARLEPELFSTDDQTVQGGIMIENTGLGTADGVAIRTVVRDPQTGREVWTLTSTLPHEIGPRPPNQEVGGSQHLPIQFDAALLPSGATAPYALDVELTTRFRRADLDPVAQTFTLQIGSPAAFTQADIPWDEFKLPTDHLFKGRDELLTRIESRLRSAERVWTHILYGLTRTGKTSLLHHLKKRLDLTPTGLAANERFLCVDWPFDVAANQRSQSDLAAFLLTERIGDKLRSLDSEHRLLVNHALLARPATFGDWEPIMRLLLEHGLYPIFLIDEFTFYKNLVDQKRLDASFLAVMRRFAIGGLASFVCAGTYGLRALMRDPSYGITGQFVNAAEIRVSRIDRVPCLDLMSVMEPQLTFTDDAKDHIATLSHRLPHFVQLICKRAASYALATRRSILGFPEIERVAQAMTGQTPQASSSTDAITDSSFNGNMYTPNDPLTFAAVFTTLCALQGDSVTPRFVSYREIQETWRDHGLHGFESTLALALDELVEREILFTQTDEKMPTYRIGADLFRRWWHIRHPHLELVLDALEKVL